MLETTQVCLALGVRFLDANVVTILRNASQDAVFSTYQFSKYNDVRCSMIDELFAFLVIGSVNLPGYPQDIEKPV